jgi:glycosyltransferase involved in cell wall biosynthesis
MSKINIIYLLPELKNASGGAKVIYNHSSILNNLNKNVSSKIIHLKKKLSYKFETSLSKRISFFNNDHSGWNVKKMKISKNFAPDKSWHNKNVSLSSSLKFDQDKDFVILPEIWAHFAVDLGLVKKKINYSIFVQGFYHMNSTNDFLKIKSSYENAKFIITVSDYSIAYLKKMFPKLKNKIFKINFSIDENKIKIRNKSNLITFMPRKLPDHANLLNFYLNNLLPKNWKIIPLVNLNEAKLFEALSRSKIFLSFSHLEGTGIPPIEAALSGNKVIGYTGGGGSVYWKKPIFIKIENGEIADFGQKIIQNIKNYKPNWIRNTKNQRKKLLSQYSKKIEKKSLINLTNEILKFFR